MRGSDYVPELYTEREITRARRRHRLLGRLEGAGALIVAGMVWNLLGWIPTLLVIGLAAFVVYKLVAKDRKDSGDAEGP